MGIQAKYSLYLETSSTKDVRSLDIRVLLKLVIKSAWQGSCPGLIVFCTFVFVHFSLCFIFPLWGFWVGLSTLNFVKKGPYVHGWYWHQFSYCFTRRVTAPKRKDTFFMSLRGFDRMATFEAPGVRRACLFTYLSLLSFHRAVFNLQWGFF